MENTYGVDEGSKSELLESVKDLTAGAAGGVSQVIIGQPFDLVKVRLQTSGGGDVFRVTRGILVDEGPLAFYKGSLMPLLGIGACVSIQFGVFHSIRKIFEDYNRRHSKYGKAGLSLGQYYLAGAMAGVANSVIATPVEHVRIRLQTQPDGLHRIYAGPRHCLQQIVGKYGFAGLYRGNVACLIREFHGFGLWFLTYEALLKLDMSTKGRARSEVPMLNVAFYGGLGGEALWLGTYPIDVVKTRMQNDGFGQGQKLPNLRAAFIGIWHQHGARGFFSGISPALTRTMLTSAATFVTAEEVRKALS